MWALTMALRHTSYAASGITARAKVVVRAGSMYWLTSRTRRSTSRSTWPVSWARRLASRPVSPSCSRATLDTHFESIGSSFPPGSRKASSTTLPPTQTLRCSISGGRWRSASSRMCSPAEPRLELPAITLSSRSSLVLDRLARGNGRPKALHGRLGIGHALAELGRSGLLRQPARFQACLELCDVAGVALGPSAQAPDQCRYERDPEP